MFDPPLYPTPAHLIKRHRHLPHWQLGGSIYFLTFRSARGILPDPALRQLTTHILHDHTRRYLLHFAVLMPDHAHLLLEPLQCSPGHWFSLSEILKAIKGASSRAINKIPCTSGQVWQEEYFDRIIRDETEYNEKLNYMWNNPAKAGLVANPADYPFFIFPPSDQVSSK